LPLTENTLKTSDVNPSLYDAVFFVGGTGAMFDYIFDPAIPPIVRTLWESNKIVGAVCHGPIALTTVVLSNGKHLVDGKLMTAFSNDEELALGNANECVFCYQGIAAYAGPACNLSNPFACYGPNMPAEYSVPRTPLTGTPDPSGKPTYLIETKLKALGAKYVATYQNWNNFYFRPHVVRDGRLVTGQNPGAGWETALKVVEAVRDSLHEPDHNTDNVLESQFCSAIQQAPTDPPVVCSTAGGLCRA
jgi:putative intracellular protease/amidase